MRPPADGSGRRWHATSLVAIPSLISLLRLPLALAFLLLHDTAVRIGLTAAAAFTDWLDGWWARTRGPMTAEGALLDPITDKIFIICALGGFAASGALTPAQLLVLLARDLYVAVGALVALALRLPIALRARFPGKLLTNIQILAVVVLLLAPRLAWPIIAVAAAITLWAVLDYTIAAARSLRRAPTQD